MWRVSSVPPTKPPPGVLLTSFPSITPSPAATAGRARRRARTSPRKPPVIPLERGFFPPFRDAPQREQKLSPGSALSPQREQKRFSFAARRRAAISLSTSSSPLGEGWSSSRRTERALASYFSSSSRCSLGERFPSS